MRPVLYVVLPPAKPTLVATAGSLITMFMNWVIFPFMAEKEMSCAACTDPLIRPVSCCGKKPFGTSM